MVLNSMPTKINFPEIKEDNKEKIKVINNSVIILFFNSGGSFTNP